jgi:hypothetical protein
MATPTIMVESPSSSQTVAFLFFLDYLMKHNPYPPYPLLDTDTLYGAFQRVIRSNTGLKSTPVRTLTRGKKLAFNFAVSLSLLHPAEQDCAHVQCHCVFVLNGLGIFSCIHLRGSNGMSLMSQMLDVAHRLNDLVLILNLVYPVQNVIPKSASTSTSTVQRKKSQKKKEKEFISLPVADVDSQDEDSLSPRNTISAPDELCYKCKGPIGWDCLYPKIEIDGFYRFYCGDC